MTWTKLSDDYADETWSLSDQAFRMLTSLLLWSNRKLLDCRVPRVDLPRLCPQTSDVAEASVIELLDGGWIREDGDILVIRYHAVYQRSREEQQAIQERNQENGKKGGRPRKPGRERRETEAETQMGYSQETQMETQMGLDEDEKTHMGTQMETQRDGTGSGEVNPAIYESEAPVVTPNWKSKRIPNAVCAACGQPFESPDPDRFRVCPIQDDAHARLREAS